MMKFLKNVNVALALMVSVVTLALCTVAAVTGDAGLATICPVAALTSAFCWWMCD